MKTIIVAGITRSGLTLTMQMLNAGGYPCAGTYPAFEDFPIEEIPFAELTGKAIKVVDTQFQFPPTGEYYVIRLRRDYRQQAKSICKFLKLVARVPLNPHAVKQTEKSLAPDYKKIDSWGKRQKGFMIMDFEEMILYPKRAAARMIAFTETEMDVDKMVAVVEPRGTDCYPTMLETKFLEPFQIIG